MKLKVDDVTEQTEAERAIVLRLRGGWLLGVAFGVFACTGSIGQSEGRGPASGGPDDPGAGGSRFPADELPDPNAAENAILELSASANLTPRLRLKSHQEVFNTIKEVFGHTVVDRTVLPPETPNLQSGFFNDSTANRIGETYFLGMARLAEAVKKSVTVSTLFRFCTGDSERGEACARATARGFAEALTGKELSADQTTKLVAVYTANVPVSSHEGATRSILEALLQFPSFLYRTEFGERLANGRLRMTGSETAAALSSLLWESGPDEALRKAGFAGELNDAQGIERHATRLLAAPKARSAFSNFVGQWLGLRGIERTIKDAVSFPEYNSKLPEEFLNETKVFSEHVVFDSDSSLRTLLTADTTWINNVLAGYYGVEGNVGTGFVETKLSGRRLGVLSHGSFILAHSGESDTNPIRRGSFVQRHLLCGVIPDPPAVLDTPEIMLTGESTIEDIYPQHKISACKGCHEFMNPLGFGFEDLDTIGRSRTSDNGMPVNSAGYLLSTISGEKKTFLAGGIYETIADMPDTSACFTLRTFEYAMGRPGGKEDLDLLLRLARTFRSNNWRVLDLILDIVKSEAFTTRQLN
jgi:hypothetical protein